MATASERALAEATLWRRGNLRFLIGSMPIVPPRVGVDKLREAYDWVTVGWGKGKLLFLCCHRRFAKSSVLLVKGAEECIKYPRCRVAVISDTKEHAVDIAKQICGPIFDRAPDGVRPTWHETHRKYYFPNGSTLEFFGSEPQQRGKVRGGKFRAIIVEEGREIPELASAVESVYRPALSDTAGSQLIFATTPAEQENSDVEMYYRKAPEEDTLYEMPLSANPDYPPSFAEAIKREILGGEGGGPYQREYECQWIHNDDTRLIVPEFTPRQRPKVVRVLPWGFHWRWYCGLDPGGRDPTGLVWVAYDERSDEVYVAKELQIRELVTTAVLAQKIRDAEDELFRGKFRPHVERFADQTDLTVLFNLANEQKLLFNGSPNDDLWGNFDRLRKDVETAAMAVDPSCRVLHSEMAHARRTDNGKQILRTKAGHADVLMALYYVHRNLVRKPRPKPRVALADPMVEMGLRPAQKIDLGRWLRNPLGIKTTPFADWSKRRR